MDMRTKLVFALVAVSLGSMFVLGAFTYGATRDLLEELALRQLEAVAESKKQDLETVLTAWSDRVDLIRSRTQLRLSLREYAEGGSAHELERIRRILSDAHGSVRAVRRIAVFTPDGRLVAATGESPPQSVAQATGDEIGAPREAEARLESVGLDDAGRLVVTYRAPMELDGVRIGTAEVVLSAVERLRSSQLGIPPGVVRQDLIGPRRPPWTSYPPSYPLVFSEIMYNPSSPEDDWEWIEVFNPGASDVDLSGYVVDDINSVAHGAANIAGGTVPAGGSAVLYNADDLTLTEFEGAWGSGINLIAVTGWSAMALNNTGDTIGIWDSFASYSGDQPTHANVIAGVTYDDVGARPSDDGFSSIYLTDLMADPNDGSNWALSVVDGMTPVGIGRQSLLAGTNVGTDVGSPVPEPTGLALLGTGIGALALYSRRRTA